MRLPLFLVFIVALFVTQPLQAQSPIVKLPRHVNSPDRSELVPVISPDGTMLYFTRSREDMDGEVTFDIWASRITNDTVYEEATVLGGNLSSRFGIAVTSVSPDHNVLYVMGKMFEATPPDERIYRTMQTATGWAVPAPLKIQGLHARGLITDYSFAADQRTLVMAVNRDSTIGGRDLYVSFLDEASGSWTQPMWLGARVNSEFEEMTPFLASDNRTLYFSSERPGGIGECDVYRVVRKDASWRNWTLPENLGAAVNRPGRTMYYSEDLAGKYAYFVWRKDTRSTTDIFRSKIQRKKATPTVILTGRVVDPSGNPLEAAIRYDRLSDGLLLGLAQSTPTSGTYRISLPQGERYAIRAEKEGFVATSQDLDLTRVEDGREQMLDLVLTPVRTGERVRLNNIFFETDQSTLLPASIPELDRLLTFMRKYPSIEIQVEGHTDNIGSEEHNLLLSRARARSVQEYLVSRGIESTRVTIEAFGSGRPVASNDDEAGRALNRRVEFRILKGLED